MSRRAGLYLSYLLLAAACVYGAGCEGCSGAPSDFNHVSLSTANQVILQGGTAVITATVANDTSSSGVSWTLTGTGTLTAPAKTSVTYNAPATVTTETTVTIHASSVSFPSQTASIVITIEPSVSITTTSLAGGNYGSTYSATIAATGGVGPFAWTLSSGSLTPGLNLGASNARSVTISGTPTQQVNSTFTIKITDSTGAFATQALTIAIGPPLPLAVTGATLPNGSLNSAYPTTQLQATGGVPPFTWSLFSGQFPQGLTLGSNGSITGTPTQAGTFTFIAQVQDSEVPAITATGTFNITINNLALLTGNYAFELNGFDSTNNAVAVAGSFTADGQGHLTAGVEDVNSTGGTPKNQTFTGTYTINSNNRGLLTFSSLTGSPAYSFALNATGSSGRLIEFDSSGIRGSGDLELRTLSTCTDTTFSGNYAFGLTGQQIAVTGISTAGPDVIAGSFAAAGAVSPSTTGSIGPGELDANTPVRLTIQDQTVGGTYKATTQSTRCSLTLSSSVATLDFSVYPVSSQQSFVVQTDTVNSTSPILTAGTIQQQFGAPFSGAAGSTFTTTVVGALTGKAPVGNTYVPDVALLYLTGTGSTSFTFTALENVAGTVNTYPLSGANFQQADTYGRVATNVVSPFGPVFYMISQNTAFCIGELQSASSKPYPFFGVVQPQSTGPFTAAAVASTFVEGTGSPSTNTVPDISGSVVLLNNDTTSGVLAGAQDQSASAANTAAQVVEGTYTVTSSVAGAGNVTLTQPAALTASYLVVSPSEVLAITTTTNDVNPVVLILKK